MCKTMTADLGGSSSIVGSRSGMGSPPTDRCFTGRGSKVPGMVIILPTRGEALLPLVGVLPALNQACILPGVVLLSGESFWIDTRQDAISLNLNTGTRNRDTLS